MSEALPTPSDTLNSIARRLSATLGMPVLIMAVDPETSQGGVPGSATYAGHAGMDNSMALPLARHLLADLVESLEGSTCTCGRCGQALANLRGASEVLGHVPPKVRADA